MAFPISRRPRTRRRTRPRRAISRPTRRSTEVRSRSRRARARTGRRRRTGACLRKVGQTFRLRSISAGRSMETWPSGRHHRSAGRLFAHCRVKKIVLSRAGTRLTRKRTGLVELVELDWGPDLLGAHVRNLVRVHELFRRFALSPDIDRSCGETMTVRILFTRRAGKRRLTFRLGIGELQSAVHDLRRVRARSDLADVSHVLPNNRRLVGRVLSSRRVSAPRPDAAHGPRI